MKAFVFLCMVVAAAAAGGHKAELSQSQKNTIREYTADCVKETGVKPEVLANAKKGQFADDEALKKFTLCFFQKTGILSKDAKLNTDVALSKLPAGVDRAAVGKVLEECKKKTGKTHADTAFEVFKCYHKATPVHLI
ncbi:general odorant-binding protein 56d-like [Pectinophora gossypiella]|uniref:general odorant-binding protein 56d-like n=1 Tax=Pectinophora gossypiella TaxID=13191 RepID=UPI00214EA2EC|nr:general odorant-binding protein 56d-like [Pectinophora gossypiella]